MVKFLKEALSEIWNELKRPQFSYWNLFLVAIVIGQLAKHGLIK